jgi:hypothetical protein
MNNASCNKKQITCLVDLLNKNLPEHHDNHDKRHTDYLLADVWYDTKGMMRLTQETSLVPVLPMKKNNMKYRTSKFFEALGINEEQPLCL